MSFEEKLLRALHHPVRAHRLLAIRLLGRLGSHVAFPYFEQLLRSESDVYVIREILEALNRMGTAESCRLLAEVAVHHRFSLVRNWARELLAAQDEGDEG
ncbi:hypothetical protein RmaAA338_26600 [Rhodothermus marinus]|nr:hypothetical protein RmaAA338_26600 [Rhodothermus marinus]